jgi:two-component sensor histidine kinase
MPQDLITCAEWMVREVFMQEKTHGWQRVYAAMGLFNVLTVLAAVGIGSGIAWLYHGSVEEAQAWAWRSSNISQLSQLATRANAPGNDVFSSRDVAAEMARLAVAEHDFDKAYQCAIDELNKAGSDVGAVRAEVVAAGKHVQAMTANARAIFAAIARKDEAAAGEQMAQMDRNLALSSEAVANAGTSIQALQTSIFNRRLAQATQLTKVQAGLLVLVVAMVMFFVSYGRRLGRMFHAQNEAIAQKGRDMRLVLDQVSDGLAIVDRRGVVVGEQSSAFAAVLGVVPAGGSIGRAFDVSAPHIAAWFDVSFDALNDDALPLEVLLDQLPSKVMVGGRHLSFDYQPIGNDAAPQQFLCIARDVTEKVRSSENESVRNDALELLSRWVRDNRGADTFIDDGDALFARVSALAGETISTEQLVDLKRDLHTLKGNAGVWGQASLARRLHQVEDMLEEEGQLPATIATELQDGWNARTETVRRMSGNRGDLVEVPRAELHRLVHEVREGADRDTIVRLLEDWKEEPAAVALSRLGDYARTLARRLGKSNLDVVVDGGDVRLSSSRFQGVLSALVHVVRNAVDHAFLPDAPAPRLELRAERNTDAIVLRIADNGRGIPLDHVRERLEKLGRAANDERELLEGIWDDGVSTAETLSQTSGRGVGLAAVKKTVQAAGGSVHVATTAGRGSTFTFTFETKQQRAAAK